MEFRRSGQRDERRRRVLMEDRRGAAARREGLNSTSSRRTESSSEPGQNRGSQYARAAEDVEQPPVTCLIPKRPYTLTTLWTSGFTLIAGVQFLYTHAFLASRGSDQAVLGALDVGSPGSVMAWLSSLFLLLGAAGSVMVFAIRRHRLDDYRGRYRVWLWATVACILAGVDTATGLHTAIAHGLQSLTGTPLYGNGSAWWILAFGVLFGASLLRVLVEVRGSFLASTALLVAAAGYITGALIELQLLFVGWGVVSAMIQTSAVMTAHLSVAMAVLSYCRYVHRQAHRDGDASAESPGEGEEAVARVRVRSRRGNETVRFDSAHDRPSQKKQTTPKRNAASDADDEDEEQNVANIELSKSERRRLRKEARRKRRS